MRTTLKNLRTFILPTRSREVNLLVNLSTMPTVGRIGIIVASDTHYLDRQQKGDNNLSELHGHLVSVCGVEEMKDREILDGP